jgi:formamidopyrimidine-DNA glycosylase
MSENEVCVVCGEDASEGPIASNGDHWCGECPREGVVA